MPTYEYRCKECSHDFEVVQAFTDDALTKCPACKKTALKKVYGNVGIAFKGSGFYKNDARSSSSKKASTSTDSGDSAAKGDKKSDATADKKSDTKTKTETKKADAKGSGSKSTAAKSSD